MSIDIGVTITNLLILLGVVYKFFYLPWYRTRKLPKKEKERVKDIANANVTGVLNPKHLPGYAPSCLKHMEDLAKLTTKVKMMCDENTRQHDALHKRLDRIEDKL